MILLGIGLFAACLALALNAFGGNGDGGKTQTAGTLIQYLIPPNRLGYTRVTSFVYLSGGTAHTVTFQRALGTTTASAAAASGQAVVNLTADPGNLGYGGLSNPIAANDFIAVRHAADGVTRFYKVSSVTGLAVTLTANLAVAVTAGDKVWFFGLVGDTDGRTGNAHPALLPTVSVATTYTDREGGVVSSIAKDEPILVTSNNVTAAGTIVQLNWAYTAA